MKNTEPSKNGTVTSKVDSLSKICFLTRAQKIAYFKENLNDFTSATE